MPNNTKYDAVIVGAGPNGLAAAITLARQGLSVLVLEAKDTIGGGSRTKELTIPGFLHDVCSAIHPLGVASPFFRDIPLAEYGVRWAYPKIELGHPLDNGQAVFLERSVEATAEQLGLDGPAYRRLMNPLVNGWKGILKDMLGPLRLPRSNLFRYAWFGMNSLLPATALARLYFRRAPARAIFTGMSAHSMLPLNTPVTSGFGLMLAMLAHAVGWPAAEGGSQSIADALGAFLKTLKGEIITGSPVTDIADLPQARAYLFDLTPSQLLAVAGNRLPEGYRRQLEHFRYGPGVFKVDYALSAPIPWENKRLLDTATVHVGGTMEEIVEAEGAVWKGQSSQRPYVLLAQQTLVDPSRAPEGRHTAWAYCHVPAGSKDDMTGCIEEQIERFAPGFMKVILARNTYNAAEMETYNPNYVGGDINGGVQDLGQFFTRPVRRWNPYSTPNPQIWLCSSSTPPGGGVHGMCGYHAANSVINKLFK
jgi:phytoene dehydrogenase-like protein